MEGHVSPGEYKDVVLFLATAGVVVSESPAYPFPGRNHASVNKNPKTPQI